LFLVLRFDVIVDSIATMDARFCLEASTDIINDYGLN